MRARIARLVAGFVAVLFVGSLSGCEAMLSGLAGAMMGDSSETSSNTAAINYGYTYGPVQSYYDTTMNNLMWSH